MSDFGTRLRLVRTESRMTMQEMADVLGHSWKTEEAYENGRTLPSIERMQEIAHKLGVPFLWLVGEGGTFAFDSGVEDYIKVVNAGFQAMADEIEKLRAQIENKAEKEESQWKTTSRSTGSSWS